MVLGAKDPKDDAPHLGVVITGERLEQRPQREPTRRGSGQHRAAPNVGAGVRDPPPDVGLEPGRVPLQHPTERLVRRGAHVRIFSGGPGANGVERVVPATAAETEEQIHAVL